MIGEETQKRTELMEKAENETFLENEAMTIEGVKRTFGQKAEQTHEKMEQMHKMSIKIFR